MYTTGDERPVACPPLTPGRTVLDLFDNAVREHGDRLAIVDGDRVLTYRELDRAAAAAAGGLLGRGLAAEDAVAVHLPRGAAVFVAILGVLKAGGAYVPVDIRNPRPRRELMITNSRARFVITNSELRSDATIAAPVVTLDELAARMGRPALPSPEGSQAACVLFTSGSSSVPKAVVLEHRNLAYFAANPSLPLLHPEDRVAHVSSLSFDAFTFELWCTLSAGAAIVVLPTVADLLTGDLGGRLRANRITAMLAPTMVVNHVAREDSDAFAGLRLLYTGGDVVSPAACAQLLAGGFSGDFYNLYGPTEGTTACTGHHVVSVSGGDVPIGVPLAGALVYLLGPDRQPVADGEVGELYIGGAGVARGYLDQPELTESRFLRDPGACDGARMYATGDLARRRDGLLEFRGRADDQVKIRGYRVEPREVEQVISALPGVADVAVIVSGIGDGKHLVALITANDGLSLPSLRSQVAELLPHYLVPSAFAQVAAIPANGHGKRDLDRLRQMAVDALNRNQAVRPRDEIEQRVAVIWEQLLGAEQIGIDDDFFELGGNSLLAFRVRRRLSADLGVAVDVEDVLGTSRLADLAALLRDRLPASDTETAAR